MSFTAQNIAENIVSGGQCMAFQKLTIEELEQKQSIFLRLWYSLKATTTAVKSYKQRTKDKVTKNLTTIYSNHLLRNYVYRLMYLCWALAFTFMCVLLFGASIIMHVNFYNFIKILIVIIGYMVWNRLLGSWTDKKAWRRWTIDGLMLLGIISLLITSGGEQIINIGTFMFGLFTFNSWKKFIEYNKHYKMALQAKEEGEKDGSM